MNDFTPSRSWTWWRRNWIDRASLMAAIKRIPTCCSPRNNTEPSYISLTKRLAGSTSALAISEFCSAKTARSTTCKLSQSRASSAHLSARVVAVTKTTQMISVWCKMLRALKMKLPKNNWASHQSRSKCCTGALFQVTRTFKGSATLSLHGKTDTSTTTRCPSKTIEGRKAPGSAFVSWRESKWVPALKSRPTKKTSKMTQRKFKTTPFRCRQSIISLKSPRTWWKVMLIPAVASRRLCWKEEPQQGLSNTIVTLTKKFLAVRLKNKFAATRAKHSI
jgi:hypothetical protein